MFATAALFIAVLLSQAGRPAVPLPQLPTGDLTLPPETASTVTILEGRGVQIYTCAAAPAGYHWAFKAPEAQLFNLATGKPAGHHDAGPTWTLDDGSSVRGTVLHSRLGSTPADLPWLLLQTQPNSTGQTIPRGELAPVTYVRRYNTHGGVAPLSGCDAHQAGQSLRVPYTASYAFYATPGTHSNLQTAPGTPAPAPPPPSPPTPPPQ